MLIRKAKIEDLQQLLDIYNYEVVNGTATLDLNPKSIQEWEQWFYAHNVGNHPLFVAEIDGKVAGYTSFSSFREKEAYKSTVELSVYISPDFRRQGVATALMQYILDEANKSDDIHTIVSVITDGNDASQKLHQKFGFEFCGTIKEVGTKFGRYVNINNYSISVKR